MRCLLFPSSSLHSGKFFFGHSVASSEISWESQLIVDKGVVVSWGSGMDELTCCDFCIYFDSRVCRNPGLGKLNSFMNGDPVTWLNTAVG